MRHDPKAALAAACLLTALVAVACAPAAGGQPGAGSPSAPPVAAATTADGASAAPSTASPVPPASAAPKTTPDAPAASDGVPDACALFSIAQASSLAGATLTDTVKGGGPSGLACQYKGGGVFVTVTLKQLADPAAAVQALEQVEAQVSGSGGPGTVAAVDGLGDRAFESRAHTGAVEQTGIVVARGADLLSVLTNTSPADAALRHCAEVIIGQL
jgi:hypothetical protein